MNKIFCMLIMISVVFLYSCMVYAGNKGEGDTYAFLKLGGGARAMGMGNAYVSMADDATAGYWNPAGLALLKNKELSLLMYRPPIIDEVGEKYMYGSVGWPLNKKCVIGVTGVNLSVNDIQETAIGNYDEPIILGKFNDTETALIGSLGWELFKDLCWLGVNGKYIHHSLYGHTGTGFGVDLGCMANLSEAWDWRGIFKEVKFGAIIRYMGDKTWKDTGHSDPGYLAEEIGFAWSPIFKEKENSRLTFAISGEQLQNQPLKLSFGGEGQLSNIIARAGVDNDKKITLGFGVKLKNLKIDWAYTPTGEFKKRFGTEQQISLSFSK